LAAKGENRSVQAEAFVEHLRKNEASIAERYLVLADQFPRQRNFWTKPGKEEKGHARWVEKLA